MIATITTLLFITLSAILSFTGLISTGEHLIVIVLSLILQQLILTNTL